MKFKEIEESKNNDMYKERAQAKREDLEQERIKMMIGKIDASAQKLKEEDSKPEIKWLKQKEEERIAVDKMEKEAEP